MQEKYIEVKGPWKLKAWDQDNNDQLMYYDLLDSKENLLAEIYSKSIAQAIVVLPDLIEACKDARKRLLNVRDPEPSEMLVANRIKDTLEKIGIIIE